MCTAERIRLLNRNCLCFLIFFVVILDCIERIMDEEEDETSSFRSQLFDLSIKRSNSTPALPLLINTTE